MRPYLIDVERELLLPPVGTLDTMAWLSEQLADVVTECTLRVRPFIRTHVESGTGHGRIRLRAELHVIIPPR